MIHVSSCKLYLPLEGNANDASGNSNNGTVGGAVLATGLRGRNYSFDGANDYVNIDDSASLGFSSAFTIGFWINQIAYNITEDEYIWKAIRTTNQREYIIRGISGAVRFFVYQNGDTSVYKYKTTGAAAIPLSQWKHICAVFSGTDVNIYIDGILNVSGASGSSGTITSVFNGTAPLQIARDYDNPTSYCFNGLMDEVVMFNKALSEVDIRRVMLGLHPLG